MDSKQQKKYDQALDKMELTDSQRDAFDHTPKRSLVDLDQYQNANTFNLLGYKLSKVMDDIVLAQYVDLSTDGQSVIRNGIHIPLAQVQRTWRLARVLLIGPLCKYTQIGDIVCFPDDKGMKVDNISIAGVEGSVRNCIFLNEERFFGICECEEDKTVSQILRTGSKKPKRKSKSSNDNKSSKS